MLGGANTCPVLYYILGGVWQFGSPIVFEPDVMVDHFASRSIVMVIVSFRVAAMSFWHTPKGTRPENGNYAIYGECFSTEVVEDRNYNQMLSRDFVGFNGKSVHLEAIGRA
jgi:hypothetical protein